MPTETFYQAPDNNFSDESIVD